MFSFLILALLVAIGVAVFTSAYGARKERLRTIEGELRALGAAPVRAGNAVIGSVGGMALTYELRPGGRNTAERTFCTALIPAECPRLEMELRPQTGAELRHVEQGRAIDLVLGDDAFDDAFIVEAAPSDIARAVLDEPIRAALLTFLPCRLTVAARELCFDKRGYIQEAGEVRRLLELCIGACVRLAALSSEMQEKQLELARAGELGGYRGLSPDALRLVEVSGRSADELAALHAARGRRRAWQKRQFIMIATLVGVGLLAWTRCH